MRHPSLIFLSNIDILNGVNWGAVLYLFSRTLNRGMNMQIANVGKSVGLVGLLLTSLMIGLVTVPTASASMKLLQVQSLRPKHGAERTP